MFDALPSYQKKLHLIQLVNDLPLTQFDELVFALEPPQSIIPIKSTPQEERGAALLHWAESPIGPGLIELEQILEDIVAVRKLLSGWINLNIESAENSHLIKSLKDYLKSYRERHGKVKVVCVYMDEPVPLDSIYTTTKVVDRSESECVESIETTSSSFHFNLRQRKFEAIHEETKEAFALASQEQYLMLLGAPGIGKSTFLRKVGLECLKCRNWNFLEASDNYEAVRSNLNVSRRHTCIPVFIELKQIVSSAITIEKLIVRELRIGGFSDPKSFMELALQQGRLLILFDGLDEVQSKHKDYTITEISDFVDQYSRNRFILSCRSADYIGGFYRFKDVTVADFEDHQIESFINNWFNSDEDQRTRTAKRCWELLNRPEYIATKELAKTPLLLTLLCAIYNKRLVFPKNRSSTYGAALDVVLKEWAAEKRIQREPIYQELSIELERDLLSEIAYENFLEYETDSDTLLIRKRKAVEQIRKFLMNNLNAPKYLNGEKVLDEIEVQQGILIRRSRDTYSFSHLTLQEYLAAQWIVDNEDVINLNNSYLTNERWREVFLLVSGLLPGRRGADKLLIPMNNKALTFVKSKKVFVLFKWAEKITEKSAGEFNSAAKRIFAISLLIEIIFGFSTNKKQIKMLNRMRRITFEKPNIFESINNEDRNSTVDRNHVKRVLNIYGLCRNRGKEFKAICSELSGLNDISDSRCAVIKDALLARIPNRDLGIASEFRELNILQEVQWERLISRLVFLQKFVSSREKKYEEREKYLFNNIHKIWLSELKITLDRVQLSEQEVDQLSEYIYTNELILRCKESAVKVTPQVWGKIEKTMFSTITFNKSGNEESPPQLEFVPEHKLLNTSQCTTLRRTLVNLGDTQFNSLVSVLAPPPGSVLSDSAILSQRVVSLLNWVVRTGPGISGLKEVMDEVFGLHIFPDKIPLPAQLSSDSPPQFLSTKQNLSRFDKGPVRIFLAHASEDKPAVIHLYNRLKQQGYVPWLDRKDLMPGQQWRVEIPKAIRTSDVFLACLSQQSVDKQGYIQRELRMALNECADRPPETIYLIPLRLDNCQIPELRQEEYGVNLLNYQWVDYFEPDGFKNLVESIDHHFASLKTD